tara:strand:+ start:398 stop:907 length:510 start_codon:yes stop_codon:yes gene_type:complete
MGRHNKKGNSAGLSQRCLRKAQEAGELYGIVIKIYGGGRCEVGASDGKKYICIIRNKFRGRGKRDNQIRVGTIVLVGTREWERAKKDKLNTTDLLYVYTDSDVKQLDRLFPAEMAFVRKSNPNNEEQVVIKDPVFEFAEETGSTDEKLPVEPDLPKSTICGPEIDVDDI